MGTSNLMEQILSRDNLNAAYLQAVRNKGVAGVDGMTVEELSAYLSENGENIKEQLRTRRYKPKPVRRVEIPKPDGGTRNLGASTTVDRFVQQAIAQVLTPISEEQFHDHSYGFGPKRYAQQAVLRALEMMNDGHNQIMDVDLVKFFDTVNHDKLMTIFGRTIKDGDVISMVKKILVNGVMIDDEYEDTVVGTPRGGNISPLLANIMLNELDKELEVRRLDFIRCVNDLIVVVGSRQAAKRVVKSVARFIEEKFGLKVNAERSRVDRPKGIEHLGFGFCYDSFAKGYKVGPHPKAAAKSKAQMKKYTSRSWGVSNGYKIRKLNRLIRGWIDHFKIGSMKRLCTKVDGQIRYQLRMCIWKHWGTPKDREKNLTKLGLPPNTARGVSYAKGYVRVCRSWNLHICISRERLAKFDLISTEDYCAEKAVTC